MNPAHARFSLPIQIKENPIGLGVVRLQGSSLTENVYSVRSMEFDRILVLAGNGINVTYEFKSPCACSPCKASMKVLVHGYVSDIGTNRRHYEEKDASYVIIFNPRISNYETHSE